VWLFGTESAIESANLRGRLSAAAVRGGGIDAGAAIEAPIQRTMYCHVLAVPRPGIATSPAPSTAAAVGNGTLSGCVRHANPLRKGGYHRDRRGPIENGHRLSRSHPGATQRSAWP